MTTIRDCVIAHDLQNSGTPIDKSAWVEVDYAMKLTQAAPEPAKVKITIIAQDDNESALKIDFANGAIGSVSVLKNGRLIKAVCPRLTRAEMGMLTTAIEESLVGWVENPWGI